MRLLYLSLMSPVPINNGARMRTSALLRALAAEGHRTTLVAFADPGDIGADPKVLATLCTESFFIPMATPTLASMSGHVGRLRALLTSRPYAVRRFRSAPMRARLDEQLRLGHFEGVVCDSVYSMINLPATNLPMVLDCPNVEHVILQRYVTLELNYAKKLYARLERRKLERWERANLRKARLALACSELDRSALQALCPGLPIRVAPNTIDLTHYDATSAPLASDEPIVLFTGGMDWYPNRDAVDFFVTRMWPAVRTSSPRAKFMVAGRNPSAELRAALGREPGVELTGTVPDMRPVLARATVVVVPLRIGSGTRLKILEAAAMKKPVVSTSVGLEGLDFTEGTEVIVADDPGRFAASVTELLGDASRRATLGLAGRRRVEHSYGEAAMRAAVRDALATLERPSE